MAQADTVLLTERAEIWEVLATLVISAMPSFVPTVVANVWVATSYLVVNLRCLI